MTPQELAKRIAELERKFAEIEKQKPILFTYKNTGGVTTDKSIKVLIDGSQYQINVL